jgi:methylated-DNA-[protein]-cysteine S-methyltransferase
MSVRDTSRARIAELVRSADPLPPSGDLPRELSAALSRTRKAVAAERAARSTAVAAVGAARSTAVAAVGAARIAPVRGPGADDARMRGPIGAFIQQRAPWGVVHIAAGDAGIVSIELASETADFIYAVSRRLGGPVVPDSTDVPEPWRRTLATAARELDEYFAGTRRSFDLPVDLRGVSAWDRLVLGGARRLGYGEITSYGGLAKAIGRPRAARAVGGALGRNPIPVVIPCHRIVAGDGTIGGYGGGGPRSRALMLGVKRSLLAIEGVTVGR